MSISIALDLEIDPETGKRANASRFVDDGGESGIIFEDDFSSGDLTKTMNGFEWGNATNLSVISGFSRAGNTGNCVRFNFNIAAEAVSELRFNLGAAYREVWMRYYLFYPNGDESPDRGTQMILNGSNNKFFRLYGLDGDTEVEPRVGFSYYDDGGNGSRAGFQSGIFNNNTTSQVPYDAAEYVDLLNETTRGTWIKVVTRAVASDMPAGGAWNSGNGAIGMWVNDVGDEITGLNNRHPTTLYNFRGGYFQGAQDVPWQGTTGRAIYMSDLTISTEDLT